MTGQISGENTAAAAYRFSGPLFICSSISQPQEKV